MIGSCVRRYDEVARVAGVSVEKDPYYLDGPGNQTVRCTACATPTDIPRHGQMLLDFMSGRYAVPIEICPPCFSDYWSQFAMSQNTGRPKSARMKTATLLGALVGGIGGYWLVVTSVPFPMAFAAFPVCILAGLGFGYVCSKLP